MADRREYHVTVDRYTRVCLTVIAGLLTVLIVGLWAEVDPLGEPADAQVSANGQIFGSTVQRGKMLDQQKEMNKKLDAILEHLKGGTLKVRVIEDAPQPGGDGDEPEK
jgi:hypothetical protein